MDEGTRRVAVLLDEQPLWLDAMAELLRKMDVETVGRTTRPTRALTLVVEHSPDVFIASTRAFDRELDALSCIRRVADDHPDVKRVVLSQSSDSKDIDAAFAAGANVYCLKTSHPDDLASAIRQIFETSIYFLETMRLRNPAVRASTVKKRASAPRPRTAAAVAPTEEDLQLTERELEILRLVADGYSNSQLARMLWLSEQTVKFHLSNIYRKLKVSNRTEAARWAHLHDLLISREPVQPSQLSNEVGA
jgi:DNA-binding NarL/FixJ family response regulator